MKIIIIECDTTLDIELSYNEMTVEQLDEMTNYLEKISEYNNQKSVKDSSFYEEDEYDENLEQEESHFKSIIEMFGTEDSIDPEFYEWYPTNENIHGVREKINEILTNF